jgi:hypothetical protein
VIKTVTGEEKCDSLVDKKSESLVEEKRPARPVIEDKRPERPVVGEKSLIRVTNPTVESAVEAASRIAATLKEPEMPVITATRPTSSIAATIGLEDDKVFKSLALIVL